MLVTGTYAFFGEGYQLHYHVASAKEDSEMCKFFGFHEREFESLSNCFQFPEEKKRLVRENLNGLKFIQFYGDPSTQPNLISPNLNSPNSPIIILFRNFFLQFFISIYAHRFFVTVNTGPTLGLGLRLSKVN